MKIENYWKKKVSFIVCFLILFVSGNFYLDPLKIEMAVAFFVRIRGIFLVSDAPLHQHQHMFDEHFLLNTVIIKTI